MHSHESNPGQDTGKETGPSSRTLNRRHFFRNGLVGGGLLFVAGGGWLALRKGDVSALPPGPLQSLMPANYPVMLAFIETVIPPDLVTAQHVAMAVDRRLSHASPTLQKEFNLGLGMLENGLVGRFTRGSGVPFSALDAAGRAKGLLAWRDSRITLLSKAYHGMRKVSLGGYYAEAAANRRSGYPGPPFEKPDPGPLTERGPITRTVAASAPVKHPALQPDLQPDLQRVEDKQP